MLPNKHHCLSIKTKLKLRRSITFSIILGFIAIVTCMPVSADSLKNINVLFVFSWHQDMPWQVEIEKGFKEHLKKESSKSNLFLEYMDAGRFKSRQQIYIFKDYLSKKYMGHQIDYVIYESRPAFKLFKSYPKLFENAKKYIVNPGPIHDSIHSESFTAIPVNANYEKAAQEILTVSKGKTIYLIAGATKSGKERTKKFTDSLSKFDPGKEVIPLIGLPMDQLLKKISNLKSDSIIFYLLVFQDGDGIRYIPYDAATQISHQASVPVYSLWTSLLGSGIVGGYMLSGEMVGQVAASILMNPKFAKNIDPKNLTSEFHGFFYDWRQLKRWGIEENLQSSGSRIVFKEPTFYEYYYHEIIAGSLIIILLISLIWNRRLKKEMSVRLKVEKNLQESENRFRSLSDAAFEGILITRKTKILDANMTLEKLFGYTKEEVISVKATNFVVPEERENVLNKVLSGYEEPYETLGLKKDGTIIPIEVHAKKISYRGQEARVTAIRDLTKQRKAEEEIKKLQGLLPICSSCKKIRDDSGYWNRIEEYIQKHSDAKFSHGICPECSDKLYGKEDWYIEMKNEEQQKK